MASRIEKKNLVSGAMRVQDAVKPSRCLYVREHNSVNWEKKVSS